MQFSLVSLTSLIAYVAAAPGGCDPVSAIGIKTDIIFNSSGNSLTGMLANTDSFFILSSNEVPCSMETVTGGPDAVALIKSLSDGGIMCPPAVPSGSLWLTSCGGDGYTADIYWRIQNGCIARIDAMFVTEAACST